MFFGNTFTLRSFSLKPCTRFNHKIHWSHSARYLALALAWLCSCQTIAETNYIKDQLLVPLRSGASSQHRILHKGLRSSTAVEVLGRSDDGSWVNVRVNPELEGWIPKQYLLSQPTAAIKLAKVQKELKNTQAQLRSLQESAAKQGSDFKTASAALTKAEQEKQAATMELRRIRSISSGAIELDAKYQRLLEQHELLQTQNDTLNAENSGLKADKRFSFMAYGAILVIIGMFMAVLIPRLKVKSRHSEWAN